MNCAGSTSLLKQVPKRPAGLAAQEGTAQHSVMELILPQPKKKPVGGKAYATVAKPSAVLLKPTQPLKKFIGAKIDGIVITKEHLESIEIAWAAYIELVTKHHGKMWSEILITLTPDAWGYADIVLYDERTQHLIALDWKFGFWEVEAKDNDQGMFYLAAARKTLQLKVKTAEIIIVQPAMDPAIDRATYTAQELDAFETSVYAALKASKAPMPVYTEGSWCTWCDAKLVCPPKTQRLATLTAPNHILDLDEVGQRLLTLKSWDKWRAEAEERIHHELEHGVAVNGWKLVNKRAIRQWNDEKKAVAALKKAKVDETDYLPRKLISPAQAEKFIDVDKLSDPVSSGTTIAPLNDKRHAVLPAAAIGQALKKLGMKVK
jgi:hypothetical protein